MPWTREDICKIAALELKDGYYCNLGIGMPTKVANYIPDTINVTLQSENGMLGMGPFPSKNEVDACLLYTSPSPRDMRRSRMPSSA